MRALVLVAALAKVAHADLRRAPPVIVPTDGLPEGSLPRVLVLDRCAGGCLVKTGPNDASNNTSNIPMGTGDHTVAAFAFGDAEWSAIVTCVAQVYSPYDITVTQAVPPSGTAFDRVLVAGLPQNVGLDSRVLGVAPLAQDCRVLANSLAFVFANNHPVGGRVDNICWTVAQESAHIFGLDHEYEFTDGASACSDPMTYRTDCGGQKFFRDRDAQCGEDAVRACNCKGTQDSHRLLLDRFGAGTITTTPPTVSIIVPLPDTPFVNGQAVQAMAGAQRGVDKIQLLLNGYPWMTSPGAPFGTAGQPETTYPFVPPKTVPDGIIDIQVRAIDDLGVATTTAAVRVTKGTPCVDAGTCLTGQKCDAGKCLWDPPAGEIGAACGYPQFCVSGSCPDGTCQQGCDPDSSRPQCPDSYSCDTGSHACTQVGAGCCSVAAPHAGWFHGGLGVTVVAFVFRRRRSKGSARTTRTGRVGNQVRTKEST